MAVNFRISDGASATPWLSPDIEPGQAQGGGGFTVVGPLRTGDTYDFRVTVHNDGNEDAVPWSESPAAGAFVGPLPGVGGLAWPLSGAGRTIVNGPGGGTRVELVPQGTQYGLELQSTAGTTVKELASTLDPNDVERRVAVTYSPNGSRLVLFDFNRGSDTVAVDIFAAQAGGGLAAGTQIMGSGSVPSYAVFLQNLTFVALWNQTEFAGLNFAFAPEQRSLFLTWRESTGDNSYAVLDLRPKPRAANRVSITNLLRSGVGRHLFSPAGDVFALIPTQLNERVELFELPSGQEMTITTNGHPSGPLELAAFSGELTVVNANAYGGIALNGISTRSSSIVTIDPPFRTRCAAQVHLWTTTPAGAATENGPGNLKLPESVNKQGASAYLARVNAGQAAAAVVLSQYRAPVMMSATDHRCAFAEAYSVADARPFQAKQRPSAAFQPLTWAQVGQRNLAIVAPNSPYFIVPYGLTNDTTQRVDIQVVLELGAWRGLPPIRPLATRRRVGRLDVTGLGFIDYPCGVLVGRDQIEPVPELRLAIEPGELRVVGVLIDVATEPDPARLDVAVVHVRERRSDGVEGGVTIVAASNPDLMPTALISEEPSACPIELSATPLWSGTNGAGGASRRAVPAPSEGFLVAELVNTSTTSIDDLEVWIESHSIPQARIDPLVFQSARLEGGATLRAAWPIELGTAARGRYLAGLVAASPQHTPHRVLAAVLVEPHARDGDDGRDGDDR